MGDLTLPVKKIISIRLNLFSILNLYLFFIGWKFLTFSRKAHVQVEETNQENMAQDAIVQEEGGTLQPTVTYNSDNSQVEIDFALPSEEEQV